MSDSPTKALLIRADATVAMGTGHLMRCLGLAQYWQLQGHRAIFITHCDNPALLERLAEEGIEYHALVGAYPQQEDWSTTSSLLQTHPAAWVVLDGYHFDTAYQRRIKDTGHHLLVIDDLAHVSHYEADLVLNQNIHAPLLDYTCSESTRLLLGPRFALFRQEFWAQAPSQTSVQQNDAEPPSGMAQRLLITLGGSDPSNQTTKAIDALSQLNIDQLKNELEIWVVIGASNPHMEALSKARDNCPLPLTFIHNATNMYALMAWADLAISAAGSTCWELALLGVPNLMLVLADNQRQIAQQLDQLGTGINLGEWESVSASDIANSLASLLADPARYSEMRTLATQLVDAKGVERVIVAMDQAATTIATSDSLRLRHATLADADLIWRWANETGVRDSSFSSAEIPWSDHIDWYRRKLLDASTLIYIAEDAQGRPVGLVRFDQEDSVCIISVSVSANRRGKGLGTRLIQAGCEHLFETTSAETVAAYIKPENMASIRAFKRAGFQGFDKVITYRSHSALSGILQR